MKKKQTKIKGKNFARKENMVSCFYLKRFVRIKL